MQIIVIHSFQICASNSMDLQNSQEDIIEIGLRTPYIFTLNKGGIKLAYCGYSYVKEKVLKNGNVAFRCDFPKKACKGRVTTNPDQVRKNIRLCTIVSSYEERRENIMDYLKGCTYDFNF